MWVRRGNRGNVRKGEEIWVKRGKVSEEGKMSVMKVKGIIQIKEYALYNCI